MNKFKLTPSGIDNLVERAYLFLLSNGADKKDALRVKLTIEEALLKYHDCFDEETEILYHESNVFRQLKIGVSIAGNSLNPFEIKKTPNDILMDSLLSNYSNSAPNYKYKNFVNQLDFSVYKARKMTMQKKILVALIVGTLVGLLSRLLPNGIGEKIALDYAAPLSNAFAGLFCVMAVFLTFFAIALGIVHAGDLSTLNNIGKTMLGRFFKIMSVLVLITTLFLLPFAGLSGMSLSGLSMKSIYDIFIGFIPSNPIAPLVQFNTAQIIIIGAMFGFSMLILEGKTRTLENAFTEANIVAVTCNSFINSSLIHVYVGINLFTIFASNELSGLLKFIKIVGIILAAYLLLVLVYALIAGKKLKHDPISIAKTLMPAFLINLSSASYGASFQTSIETLFANGVDIDYAAMGHNIGGLLFKPAYAILLIIGTVMSSVMYGVEFSLGNLIMIIILSMVLAMSLPTIPGSAIAGFTLIFNQLSLPGEALAVVLTLNAILDFFTVAVNGFCLQSEIMIGANKAGRIDLDKLPNN